MIELYTVKKQALYPTLEKILTERTGKCEIAKTPAGKPYAVYGGVEFSLSHSGEKAIIALSDKPVGVDLELLKGRIRESVLSRFSQRERAEIECERDFLFHWTAREAYIKLIGGALFNYIKRLEFFCGGLYLDGNKLDVNITRHIFGNGVAAVCTQN